MIIIIIITAASLRKLSGRSHPNFWGNLGYPKGLLVCLGILKFEEKNHKIYIFCSRLRHFRYMEASQPRGVLKQALTILTVDLPNEISANLYS